MYFVGIVLISTVLLRGRTLGWCSSYFFRFNITDVVIVKATFTCFMRQFYLTNHLSVLLAFLSFVLVLILMSVSNPLWLYTCGFYR